jgi:hypothetical protein
MSGLTIVQRSLVVVPLFLSANLAKKQSFGQSRLRELKRIWPSFGSLRTPGQSGQHLLQASNHLIFCSVGWAQK